MPTYSYKCDTCGKEFSYQQRISEPALTHCPSDICECEVKGKGDVHRKISKNIGLVFNGSGFYLTDYVHKKNKYSEKSCASDNTTTCACSADSSKAVA